MISRRCAAYIIFVVGLSLVISGCSIVFQKGRRSDIDKIRSLNYENEALNARLERLQQEKEKEISELEKARQLLEKRLEKEIGDKGVRLEMAEKGLSIIFLSEVLFDSGKAEIKKEAYGVLDKLANVLRQELKSRDIGIEGYTDNDPIKYSGWKSNWELSTARAVSVLHYIVDEKGIEPVRVSATGYGEYRPVFSNDTAEGRRQNRRVEIVVLPKDIQRIQEDINKAIEQKREIETQLKRYKK